MPLRKERSVGRLRFILLWVSKPKRMDCMRKWHSCFCRYLSDVVLQGSSREA